MARSRNLADLNPQRICIVKPSAFGCVVQSLPLIAALRRRFPAASISWVIRDDLQDLLAGHPDLAECLVFRRSDGVAEFLRLLRKLRSRRFDLVIDLQGLARSGLMTLATGAPVRIGLESAREGAWLGCNHVVRGTGRDVHAQDRYWRVAEALGDEAGPRRATIFVPRHERAWARSTLESLPRPVIGVHAGALWQTKRCPPEVFASALASARARFGGSIVLLGTEDDAPAADELRSRLRSRRSNTPAPDWWKDRRALSLGRIDDGDDCTNLTGATTLKQLAAILADVDVLLCNDSGPMHLAAAFETPVVGMFTCTSPELSGPQGRRHQLLSADVPCAAGYHKSCPLNGRAHLQCHRRLPVERISQALERILTHESQRYAPATIGGQAIDARYAATPA